VKLKLDENLGRRCIAMLRSAGHDVATVFDQQMTSTPDDELIKVCTAEGRALVTLDLDFSNPLIYPPAKHAGIAVLRLPDKFSSVQLSTVVQTLIDALRREELAGKLWSVEVGRIRIYQPPDN